MSDTLSIEVLEAAATWYVDLQNVAIEASASVHQAHIQWLEQHPSHRQAWARVEKLQKIVEPAQGSEARTTLTNARISRRQSIKTLSLLLVAGVGGASVWQQKESIHGLVADYRTDTGENREVNLADGGVLHLNTATAIDVIYSDALREIRLYSGEIQIVTARDSYNRPFIIRTSQGVIRALGTRFWVRSDNDQTDVGVQEHAVEVTLKATEQVIRVETNQQLNFSAKKSASIQPLQSDANAWTRGLLVVSNWRLDHFLTELSRYRPGRIGCDSHVANLRISGAFHLNNTDAVLENLAATLPIEVRYITRYWIRVGTL